MPLMCCGRSTATGQLARRTTLFRRRKRTIGQGEYAEGFDAQGTLHQLQNYAQQAQGIYNAAQSAIDAANASDEQKRDIAFHAIMTGMALGVPGFGTALAAAFEALHQIAPNAGSGPGTCVTDPPKGCWDTTWPHYLSMQKYFGYPSPDPRSFEAFAYGIIAKNYELAQNCCWDKAVPARLALATAIDSWNRLHGAPTRMITRNKCVDFGCQIDPIQFALYDLDSCTKSSNPFDIDTSCWPQSMHFLINDGPPPKKVIPFHLGPAPKKVVPLHLGPPKTTFEQSVSWWLSGKGSRVALGPWSRR